MSAPAVNPNRRTVQQQTGRQFVTRYFAPLQQGPVKTFRTTAFGAAQLLEVRGLDEDTGLPNGLDPYLPADTGSKLYLALFVHDVPAQLEAAAFVSDWLAGTDGAGGLGLVLDSINTQLGEIAASLASIPAPATPPTVYTPTALDTAPAIKIALQVNLPATIAVSGEWVSLSTAPGTAIATPGVPAFVVFASAQAAGPLPVFPAVCSTPRFISSGDTKRVDTDGLAVWCQTQAAVVEGVHAGIPDKDNTTEALVPVILDAADITDALYEAGLEFTIGSRRYVVVGAYSPEASI